MAFDSRLLSGVSVLIAVVEAGTMARAAEALGLSPSGVGRAVARLETRLGVRLLERTTRSLRLTDEGRRFCERVGPMLDGIEEAAIEAAGSGAVVRGRLRVNIDSFFSRFVLAAHVAAFLDRYPHVTLELVMRDSVADLVADGFDLAVRFGDPPSGALVARRLVDARVLTVAAPAYLARHGRPAHPSDLAAHDCIDFWDAAHNRAYDWEFQRQGEALPVQVRARLMTSDPGTMLEACIAGAGVAQILDLGTRAHFERGELELLLPEWNEERFPLHAIYPSRHHRAAKVRAFVDFVLETTARLREG